MSGRVSVVNGIPFLSADGSVVALQSRRAPRGVLPYPPDFAFPWDSFPYTLSSTRSGVCVLGFDESHLIPAACRYTTNIYFVAPTGNDSTGDGSSATPWRGIDKALTDATYPCIINVSPGLYDQANSWNAVVPGGTCWVRRHGLGRVISAISWADAISITQVGGTPVWSATRSNVLKVVDRLNFDSFGLPIEYDYVATNAGVTASAGGTWSNDGGNTTVDIKRIDGLQVTTENTCVLLSSVQNGRMPTSGEIYVSGIDFWGGNQGAFHCTGSPTGRAYFSDCRFMFSGRQADPRDGLRVNECAFVFGLRVLAAKNTKDGVNLTPSGAPTITPNGVFIDRVCVNNGGPGSTSNNGLTSHDGSLIIDIRGVDEYNRGGNLIPVTNGKIWAVDHLSKSSQGDQDLGGDFPSTGYQCNSGGEIYLDGCGDTGSKREMSVASGSKVRIRHHDFGGGTVAGDVQAY